MSVPVPRGFDPNQLFDEIVSRAASLTPEKLGPGDLGPTAKFHVEINPDGTGLVVLPDNVPANVLAAVTDVVSKHRAAPRQSGGGPSSEFDRLLDLLIEKKHLNEGDRRKVKEG